MEDINIKRKKISAIVAIYRDAPAIPYMYSRLVDVFQRLDVDGEIIFVNDCSPDNAREVLTELAQKDPRVIVINHSRNFGSQNAFTSGMKICSGDAVVLLDGDLQDPPEVIEEFYPKWLEGYDVVYGIRVKRDATLFLQISYKLFYRLFAKLAYITIPLDAGDFSLIDQRVVNALNNMPENNRFLRGMRSWVGYKQVGVPYVRPERMFGRTTNSLLKNLGWAKKAIFSFSYVPLDLLTWASIIILIFSMLGLIFNLLMRILVPGQAPQGFTTVIILILFMGGIQLLGIGIIGSYLAHMYDEIKRRPPYIVESYQNYNPASERKSGQQET